jgi:hypothetical protein
MKRECSEDFKLFLDWVMELAVVVLERAEKGEEREYT